MNDMNDTRTLGFLMSIDSRPSASRLSARACSSCCPSRKCAAAAPLLFIGVLGLVAAEEAWSFLPGIWNYASIFAA